MQNISKNPHIVKIQPLYGHRHQLNAWGLQAKICFQTPFSLTCKASSVAIVRSIAPVPKVPGWGSTPLDDKEGVGNVCRCHWQDAYRGRRVLIGSSRHCWVVIEPLIFESCPALLPFQWHQATLNIEDRYRAQWLWLATPINKDTTLTTEDLQHW